jgi:protein TonB
MNTAELQTRVRHQPVVAPARVAPAARSVPVVVLSSDESLAQSIRSAAGDDHAVLVVATLEEATALAASGQCGILVTDQALSRASLGRVSAQLHAHDPATITIAVGTQGDDNALIGLLSSAVVERFMLKPVSPALARLVLRSAAAEYRSVRAQPREETAIREPVRIPRAVPSEKIEAGEAESIITAVTRVRSTKAQAALPIEKAVAAAEPIAPAHVPAFAPQSSASALQSSPAVSKPPRTPKLGPTAWMCIAAAIAAVVALGWWSVYSPDPRVNVVQLVQTNLQSAQAALAAGNDLEPAESSALHFFTMVLALDPGNASARDGLQQIAQKMSDNIKNLIIEGRLAEAGIALERLRRIGGDNRKAAILESEMRRVQTHQLEILNAPAPTPIAPPVVPAVRAAAVKPVPAAAPPSNAPADHIEIASGNRASIDAAQAGTNTTPVMRTPEPIKVATIETAPAAVDTAPTIDQSASAAPSPTLATLQPELVSPERVPSAEPKLLRMIQPEYPDEARMRGLDGWVDLTLSVAPSGEVADAQVNSSSKRMFERPALAAVRKWHYEAMPLADADSRQAMRVKVQFKMDGDR